MRGQKWEEPIREPGKMLHTVPGSHKMAEEIYPRWLGRPLMEKK